MTMTKSEIDASNLKVILHSKRANIYYLEKCRVMQKDGRVLYLTEGKRENQGENQDSRMQTAFTSSCVCQCRQIYFPSKRQENPNYQEIRLFCE